MTSVSAAPEVLTLVEWAPDALLAVSPAGRVLYATAALEREFGLAPGVVADRPLAELLHPDDRDRMVQAVREVATDSAEETPRTTVVRLGGGDHWRSAIARLRRADLPGGQVTVVSLAPAARPDAAVTAGADAVLDVEEATGEADVETAGGAIPGLRSGRQPLSELVHPDDLPLVRVLLRQAVPVPDPAFGIRLAAGGAWHDVTLTRTAAGRLEVRADAAAPPGITDALPVGVLVLDAGLAVVHRNRRAVALLGTAPGTGWLQAFDQRDRQRLEWSLTTAAAGREQLVARASLVGGDRIVEVRAAPLPVPGRGDLLACVADEVTGTVRTEDEAARLTAIVEASSDLIATTAPDGRLRWINPAFRLFLSAVSDDPVGLELVELYAPWARERWEDEARPRLDQRGLWSGEMALQPIGSAEVPVSQVSVAHRDARGELTFCSHVLRDLTASKVHEAGLAHQATHDPLTDLPNRILLMDRLHTALARARRAGGVVALLFCDLDEFKAVNDRYGHAAGDRLLLTVADRLVAVLREPDTVARLGGDEFVMLCEGLRSAAEAEIIAGRVTAALSEPVTMGDETIDASASVGVAVTVDGDADAEALLRRADRAMYRVKHSKAR